MRATKATVVVAVLMTATLMLGPASGIGAATDGLGSEALLSGARFDAAFTGSTPRVTDDPDAPIRTGRWAENRPTIALAGGAEIEPIIPIPGAQDPATQPTRMASLDVDAVSSTPISVPLSRVSWSPPSTSAPEPRTPRISLTVSDQDIAAPGSGLDVDSTVFNESLAVARPSRPPPMFDAKTLTLRVTTSPALRKRGRWFLFAAGSGEAFGLNLVRDPARGWRPAGWSVEKLAEFGKAQLGIGWRKGSRQASLSAARREISAYGVSREDTVVGVSFSVTGRAPPKVNYEQTLPRAR
ncbi:MAG: hypothetical protein Q8L66_16055 [Caulobacter sp.]|nr:hypothetical protein [Caulobacter sp.]